AALPRVRASPRRPPRAGRGLVLSRFWARPRRPHAEFEEAPQLDQQLPGEGHDPHLTGAWPAAAEPRLKPAAQVAPRLIAQPGPGHLDGNGPDVAIPRLANPLFPAAVATLVRGGREARRRPELFAVAEPSPPEELVHIDPRAARPDCAQAEQLPHLIDGRPPAVRDRALALALPLADLRVQESRVLPVPAQPGVQRRRHGRAVPEAHRRQ